MSKRTLNFLGAGELLNGQTVEQAAEAIYAASSRDYSKGKSGDIVILKANGSDKEFIYDGSAWIGLGDQDAKEISSSNRLSGTINSGFITSNNANLWTSIQPNTVTLTDDIMDQIIRKLSIKPTIKHKCNSCGATLEIDSDKHIFLCKYCGSVYAIGTQMINDRG